MGRFCNVKHHRMGKGRTSKTSKTSKTTRSRSNGKKCW